LSKQSRHKIEKEKIVSYKGREISDKIKKVVVIYEKPGNAKLSLRKAAVNRFCSKPFDISHKEIEKLLKADYYGESI